MTFTMINLKDTKIQKSVKNAIAKCKKVHPRVRRINSTEVAVSNSDKTKNYIVKIETPKAGMVLAECTCEARTACYHMVAALSAPSAPVKNALAGILVKHTDEAFRIDGWMV